MGMCGEIVQLVLFWHYIYSKLMILAEIGFFDLSFLAFCNLSLPKNLWKEYISALSQSVKISICKDYFCCAVLHLGAAF